MHQAAAKHRRADRVHPRLVLANAGQRLAERRMDDAPRHPPADEQHDKRIHIRGLAQQVEVEAAQDRIDHHALESVGAAGQEATPCWPLPAASAQSPASA